MIIYGRYSSQTNDDGQFKIEKYFLFKLSFIEKIKQSNNPYHQRMKLTKKPKLFLKFLNHESESSSMPQYVIQFQIKI